MFSVSIDPEITKIEMNTRGIRSTLIYFEEKYGRENLIQFVEGLGIPLDYLENQNNWISFNFHKSILKALVSFTENSNAPFLSGTYATSRKAYGSLHAYFASFIGIENVYKLMVRASSHFAKNGDWILKKSKNDCVELEFKLKKGYIQDQNNCLNIQGQLVSIPTLYRMPLATIKHPLCAAKGHDSCIYYIRWLNPISHKYKLLGFGIGLIFFILNIYKNSYQFWQLMLVGLGCLIGWVIDDQKFINDKIKNDSEQNEALLKTLKEVEDLNQSLQNRVEERTKELKIAEEKAQKLALTDPLTQLSNRRYFDQVFQYEFQKHQRRKLGTTLVLISVDIDKFKEINDQLGHNVGDKVIISVSKILKDLVRDEDCVSRYGGDEFMVMLSHCDIDQAKMIAQRILSKANQTKIDYDEEVNHYIHLSIGIALVKDEDDSQQFLFRVDQALYQAKKNGRNQFCVFDDWNQK